MKWTEDDLLYLKENFLAAKIEDLEKHLRRNYNSISVKARCLGLRRARKWTKEEIQIILDNLDKTYSELTELIPTRSFGQIKSYCQTNKIKTGSFIYKWTEEEKRLLIDSAYNLSLEEVWDLLPHKSHDAIRGQIKNLGLSIKREKFWSPFEVDFLTKNLHIMGAFEIAKQLNRSCNAIFRKAERLGLTSNTYIIDENNDVTIFDSFYEKEVFLFLKRFVNVEKNKQRFYYDGRKCYIPDYQIVTSDKIYLVEYFGGYNFGKIQKKNNPFGNYNKRTYEKIKFYKSIQSYGFIDIYPDDIKHDFKGVIDKITFLL